MPRNIINKEDFMEYRVHQKETFYFTLKILFTVVVVFFAVSALKNLTALGAEAAGPTAAVFVFYAVFIWLFIWFQKVLLIGHLKGNGVEITASQFPEAHEAYRKIAEGLQIRKIPPLFILQEGGALNAFAVRFSGRNYIAVYSEIFSMYESAPEIVQFVLAHELGHVKRNHLVKRFWTLPSAFVPFLEAAYSRSCEHTCDRIGAAFCGEKSIQGLILLAAGKDIFSKVKVESYIESAKTNNTAAVKFAQLFMSHPYIPLRIRDLQNQ